MFMIIGNRTSCRQILSVFVTNKSDPRFVQLSELLLTK